MSASDAPLTVGEFTNHVESRGGDWVAVPGFPGFFARWEMTIQLGPNPMTDPSGWKVIAARESHD